MPVSRIAPLLKMATAGVPKAREILMQHSPNNVASSMSSKEKGNGFTNPAEPVWKGANHESGKIHNRVR